jgi:methionine aminopeptidase
MEPDLTKYNTSAKICGIVYNKLKNSIQNDAILSIKTLYELGMKEIHNQCNDVFKRINRKGPACPISINLNHYVDNYTYETKDIIIKKGDIVKIKLGVDIDGYIAMYCNTFIYNEDDNEYISFLNNMKKEIIKNIYNQNTNDEVRIFFESKCTDNDCFPIINCKSIQHDENVLKNELPKYMIFNYKKIYDNNDYLVQDNECFEFLENEIYTINLTIIPISDNDDNDKLIREPSNLYKITDIHRTLRVHGARQLYSKVYEKHYNNIFNINDYITDIKLKVGLPECIKTGIFEELPVYCTKNKQPVYSTTFTICVQNKKSLVLKYN